MCSQQCELCKRLADNTANKINSLPAFKMFLLLTVLSLGISVQVNEALYSPKRSAHLMFREEDANLDGVVDLEEMKKGFLTCDANHNKRLERQEFLDCYNGGKNGRIITLFNMYDVNKDRHVDAADYSFILSSMDNNGDNVATEEEFVKYWEPIIKKAQMPNTKAREMFHHTDVNNDGVVDRHDLEIAYEKKCDDNKDKKVERKEFLDCCSTKQSISMTNAVFNTFDANDDHHLDLVDYIHLLNTMDLNGDHVVNAEEFIQFWETEYFTFLDKGLFHY